MKALDQQTEKHKLRLFVPLCQAQSVTHACLMEALQSAVDACVNGFRSLSDNIQGRVAADLRAISRDFLLPSARMQGTPLSVQARDALRGKTGAQTFFSRELCARYFTYMDEKNNGHFVLFDDADTLQAKCRCLQELEVSPIFARYGDVCDFLPTL